MKQLTINLSAPQKENLSTLKGRLEKAMTAIRGSNSRNEQYATKADTLRREIPKLERNLNALDDEAAQKLAAKKLQLEQIEKHLEAAVETGPTEDARNLQSLTRISHDAVCDALLPLYPAALDILVQHVAPLYENHGRAKAVLPECDLLRNFRHHLSHNYGVYATNVLGEATLAVQYIDALLRGESPYKFAPAKEIPELAIFAK